MKKIIFILLFAVAAFALYWFVFRGEERPEGPKQQALTVGKHSAAFNSSIDSLLQHYLAVKDAFVENDSLKARQAGMALVVFLKGLNIDELKKDTTGIFETASGIINDVRSSAEGMGQSQVMADMRQDFRSVSENMYPLLKTIHYEGRKLFWQNCPTAFGEGSEANWISIDTAQLLNPYLGKDHARCGEVKDTIKAQ